MKTPTTIRGYFSLMKKIELIDPTDLVGYDDLPQEIKDDISELSGNISNTVFSWHTNEVTK